MKHCMLKNAESRIVNSNKVNIFICSIRHCSSSSKNLGCTTGTLLPAPHAACERSWWTPAPVWSDSLNNPRYRTLSEPSPRHQTGAPTSVQALARYDSGQTPRAGPSAGWRGTSNWRTASVLVSWHPVTRRCPVRLDEHAAWWWESSLHRTWLWDAEYCRDIGTDRWPSPPSVYTAPRIPPCYNNSWTLLHRYIQFFNLIAYYCVILVINIVQLILILALVLVFVICPIAWLL